MKNIFYAFFLSAAVLCAASCGKYEKVPGDALKTRIYTLDNGLKVFMSVNKETPRIQTYIAVKVGAKNDPSETTGLAHYFEHLMFKGTEHFGTMDYAAEKPMLDEIEQLFEVYRKTTDEAQRKALYHKIDSVSYEASKLAIPNEYDKLMALIGARGTNAWTSYDETVYTEDIPSNQIDNWARIQADRFRHGVIRGFHTELETIYEEKNMSLTKDNRKLWEALNQALYPHHPYGDRTVLGTQENLKNPSITNVKNYHDVYYVPNNIAICVAGDFNPDEMVKTIEKYFGDWEPNPSIPPFTFEKEAPITAPVEREVYGLEAEMLAIGWPLPGASDLKGSAVAEIAGSLLSNGQAGIIDLDVNQQQKALVMQAGVQTQPDYSTFLLMGLPKQGQTLDELRALALEQVAKLRDGAFDEALISSTVNNIKLAKMQQLESNEARAHAYVDAFINGIEWKDAAKDIQRYESVTKEDVVAWAKQYLGAENYAVIYKRQGPDNSIKKMEAPAITPIVMNRNSRSAFLEEIQATAVKPIEPVFTDFKKDMSRFTLVPGVEVLYKQNKLNDIFHLSFVYNVSTQNDPSLESAFNYISYLGTPEMSAQQIASRMYALACDFSLSADENNSAISLNGLSENMPEAVKIVEGLIAGAQGNEAILANLKSDVLRARMVGKSNQQACFAALQKYLFYGPEFVRKNTLTNEAVFGLGSDDLLAKVRDLTAKGHEILYYGPMSESELKNALRDCHQVSGQPEVIEEVIPPFAPVPESEVVLAQYDAKQLYYLQYSNRGEKFDRSQAAGINLYNEYFGGGMNSIVFQEMREARGLAYSAQARLVAPSALPSDYIYFAFIATQNDKMQQAIASFDEIINQMPESQAAFNIAKDGLLSQMRTRRTTGMNVLWSYRRCRRLGLDEPLDREIFEKTQALTLEDVKAVQEQWVKGRTYRYGILGDIKDLDTDYLKTLGPVRQVSLEEIFGY